MTLSPEIAEPAGYARMAPHWQDKIRRLGYPAAYALLIGDPPPTPRLLDIGTGSGALAQAYLSRAKVTEATLTDPSAEMLTAARTLLGDAPGRDYRRAALGDAALGTCYDTVLCGHVLEHLSDLDGALSWLHGRLRPGGRLYLSVSHPHWCTALLRWKWGHRAYDSAVMRAALTRAGFTDIEVVRYRSGPPSRTSRGYRATRG